MRDARETLAAAIGNEIRDPLAELYEGSAPSGPYSPDPESAGKRALRNAALDLLVATGEASEIARAERHYREASNMTDAITALSILSHRDTPALDTALADFYARWQEEPLVLDKWFAVQARAARPRFGRDRAQAPLASEILAEEPEPHPRPARQLRPRQSHRLQPRRRRRAIKLLAEQALEIDGFNPHVAARLLGAFESWRILEPSRQARAKAVLEDLAGKSLSTDSYEIVTKTLGAG